MAVPANVRPDITPLGTGKYGMLGRDGLDPDVVAEMFGYGSGDEMVRALLAAKPMKDAEAERTDAEMLRRYGDMNTPAALEAEVQKALSEHQRHQQIERLEAENSSWMYSPGINGQPDFNNPTPDGQRFLGALKSLVDSGVQDVARAVEFALQVVGRGPGQQPAQPQENAATLPFTQQAEQASQTNRNSFLQNAINRAAHSPSTGYRNVQSPEAPVNLSEGELDNIFINSFRASRGIAAS
jgi:hypothetical protein